MQKKLRSFTDWIAYFDELRETGLLTEESVVTAIKSDYKGNSAGKNELAKSYKKTIDFLIEKRCKRFLRQLEECLECGDTDYIVLLFKRMRRDEELFARTSQLPFISKKEQTSIRTSIIEQIDAFLDKIIFQLKKGEYESPGGTLQDVLYEITRLKNIQL